MGDSKSSSEKSGSRGAAKEEDQDEDADEEDTKRKVKGDAALSDQAETQNLPEQKIEMKESVRSFSTRGAAAKHAPETPRSAIEEERRKTEISVLQSVIQPAAEKPKEPPPAREAPESSPQPAQKEQPKRQSEKMREELLRQDAEGEALANLVLNLVHKQRVEKEAEEQVALSEEEIFKRSMNMSPLEQAGFVCVLEDAVAELNILGCTNNKPLINQEIKYVSIYDKLAEKEESELIELVKSDKGPKEFEEEKQFIKLQKDRGFVEEALTLTLLELKKDESFKILQDIVHLEDEMVKEEADLRFKAKNRQQEVNHCRALLESERRKAKKKLDTRTDLLATLRDEIQEMIYYNGLKYKYTDHWEQSRAEQNALMLRDKERDLLTKLSNYQELSGIERRCTAEMRTLLEDSIQSLADLVEQWMNKYETEMDQREMRITKLKEEREEFLKKLQEKIDFVDDRIRRMDEWKAHKEQLRLEAEYQLYLVRMATLIQAWWRGTMVRNHLGPYRKKKKGRKKKKQ